MGNWKKKILFILFFLIPASFLPAHEFWLQPEKFICKRGETINIRFQVGENFEGANWTGNNSRINSLYFYTGGSKDDLSKQLSGEKGDSLQLAMYDEGTAMITFNSNNSFIELEADKFNQYLKEDGLQNAIDFRTQHNKLNVAGKEFYQRSVKTLIQVGTKTNNCFKQTTGLPVDIIALYNPYTLKNNQPLKVKILFKEKPLVDYDVKLWHRIHNTTTMQDVRTNQKGELSFAVNTTGEWMVSTVRMDRLENDTKADWQSYWGSLTWGY